MTDRNRLFGVPDAEVLRFSAVDVWESDIEPNVDDDDYSTEIYEWSVCKPIGHLPGTDRVIDEILDWMEECGELVEDVFPESERKALEKDYQVQAAAQALLDVIASKLKFRMADQLVEVHSLTLARTRSGDLEPMLDGDPLYPGLCVRCGHPRTHSIHDDPRAGQDFDWKPSPAEEAEMERRGDHPFERKVP